MSKILFTILIFISFSGVFAAAHHGGAVRLSNNGTGLNYIFAYNIKSDIQFQANIGFHFEKKNMTYDIDGYEKPGGQETVLPVNLGVSKVLFDDQLAGMFRPLLFCEAGYSTKVGNNNMLRQKYNWEFQYTLGGGAQFSMGKTLNRIIIGYNSNPLIEGNMLIELSIFWR